MAGEKNVSTEIKCESCSGVLTKNRNYIVYSGNEQKNVYMVKPCPTCIKKAQQTTKEYMQQVIRKNSKAKNMLKLVMGVCENKKVTNDEFRQCIKMTLAEITCT